MVEVGEEEDEEDKVPGEDEEPDMGYGDEDEELVPIKSMGGHGGLFGSDLGNVKY